MVHSCLTHLYTENDFEMFVTKKRRTEATCE